MARHWSSSLAPASPTMPSHSTCLKLRFINTGLTLLSHGETPTLPSALSGFTSEFEMGSGGSHLLWTSGNSGVGTQLNGAIAESSNLATKEAEVDILAEPASAESTEEEKTNFEAEDDDVDILVATEPAEEQTKKQAITVEADESAIDTEYEEVDILALLEAASKREDLPDDDEHLIQVNKLPLVVWMEFLADGEQTIRCTLTAKISTIDSCVFVNSDGVKVVEKSRMGLAKELKAGSVKIISESPLVDRAMESIIGTLREGEAESAEEEGLTLAPK